MEKFKRIIFYIFKPLNPIDVVDGISRDSFTIFERFIQLKNGDLKQVMLILKHVVLFGISIFYYPIALVFFF